MRGSAIVLQRGPRALACNAEWGQHAKATVNRNVSKRESGMPCALLTNCVPSFKSLPYLASGSKRIQIVYPPVNPKRVSYPEFPSSTYTRGITAKECKGRFEPTYLLGSTQSWHSCTARPEYRKNPNSVETLWRERRGMVSAEGAAGRAR